MWQGGVLWLHLNRMSKTSATCRPGRYCLTCTTTCVPTVRSAKG